MRQPVWREWTVLRAFGALCIVAACAVAGYVAGFIVGFGMSYCPGSDPPPNQVKLFVALIPMIALFSAGPGIVWFLRRTATWLILTAGTLIFFCIVAATADPTYCF